MKSRLKDIRWDVEQRKRWGELKNARVVNNSPVWRAKSRADRKWMEDMKGKSDWISSVHRQGQESKAETARRARARASDNEEPYLNVRFPQVTNIVKWPQFHAIKSNRVIQDYKYTLKQYIFKCHIQCAFIQRLVFTDPHTLSVLSYCLGW